MDIAFSKQLNSKYFHNKKNGFFIEAGAYNGVAHSICKWFEDTLGWKGINIEPHPQLFDHLVGNRPNSVNLNYALSNKSGHTELVDPKQFRGHATIDVNKKQKFIDNATVYTVETKTYTEMIEENDVSELDLFVLDVEGHELGVLEGMIGSDVLPRVIAVETNKTNKDDILKLLEPLSYKLDYSSKADSYFVRSV